jgi:hypothetical protein
MRRWKLLGGLAVLALAGAAFVTASRPLGATREGYNRVRMGMTRAEVLSILGRPGDQTTAPQDVLSMGEPALDEGVTTAGNDSLEWKGNDGWIDVYFDPSGQVAGKDFWVADTSVQAPLENFLRRAKRLWRKWFP